MPGFPTLDPLLVATAAAFIALLLARAAIHKITDFVAFTGTLSDYRVLPESMLTPATLGLIAVEIVLAAALLWSGTRPVGALGAAGLLTFYAAMMAIPLSQGRTEISCGCGGPTDHLSGALLMRNALLVAICLVAACTITDRPLGWADFLALPFGVVTLWLLLEAGEQALQNAAYIRNIKSRLKSEV